ncbi:3-alpha-hydroxysteroid dehydrogenase [Actinomadura craniellae]|uniref:3-alpha-hydroxysteroid dehydrogenase n=1 Tax=Actinomadura craniellae TaxID=2231787 RepID=A0A365H0C1_9ACTN|nr:glucose 1-dehydrogenase [Actinomadura craniellae]RAY12529.1 3-alpha-hydroxysteroid dehydrogenase [Actinomadura craniellae]
MGRLDGKVALITGGARGMGRAHVRRFTEEGARVVFGDVLTEEGEKLAAEQGDAVRFLRMDVTEPADWERAVTTATDAFGGLDVLVNNAGIIRHRTIEEMDLAEFRHVLDVNLTGQWLGVKAVIAPMRARGGGSIINVSSVEGFIGAAGMSAYAASKFGVRGLTKSAARELGGYGIRVNSIHPGGILTAMVTDPEVVAATAESAAGLMKALPLGRLGRTREVAGLMVYLASDDSSYCTGSEVVVDGGMITGAGY